ncbi:MAG: glycosyltransferase [Bacteroidia bacterium]|nr:glycosyltransferase [Bacteroidia bacterium]
MKEISVFSIGDSNKLSSWSNVPYFFSKSFEEKGIKVNRVNLEENIVLNFLYKNSVYALLKLFYPNSSHTYFRSGLNHFLIRQKIKKAIQQYPDSDLNLFLTFSFSAHQLSSKPTLLFGDWTYLYYIQNFLKREPKWFEKKTLAREKENIQSATQVLGLFPLSAVFIKNNFHAKNCHYLGNVVNADWPFNKEELLHLKTANKKIIFIGNRKYLSGALKLIEAFVELKKTQPSAELHLIGLNVAQTSKHVDGLFHHGYLDKSDEAQKQLYYQLVSGARVIVNTQAGWGSFSAITEAMYYCTPVITTAYQEFTETYGHKIGFGYYVNEDSEQELLQQLKHMMQCDATELSTLMTEAHEAVKDFTWKNYTNKVLELLED